MFGEVSASFSLSILNSSKRECLLILIGCAKVGRAYTFDISYAGHANAPDRYGYCDIIIYVKLNWHVETTQHKIHFSFSL